MRSTIALVAVLLTLGCELEGGPLAADGAARTDAVAQIDTEPSYLAGQIGGAFFDGPASLDLDVFDGAVINARVVREQWGMTGYLVLAGAVDLAALSQGVHVISQPAQSTDTDEMTVLVCADGEGFRYDQPADNTVIEVEEALGEGLDLTVTTSTIVGPEDAVHTLRTTMHVTR